jgi:hypothetical protein
LQAISTRRQRITLDLGEPVPARQGPHESADTPDRARLEMQHLHPS